MTMHTQQRPSGLFCVIKATIDKASCSSYQWSIFVMAGYGNT
jgi:hypothetical protein